MAKSAIEMLSDSFCGNFSQSYRSVKKSAAISPCKPNPEKIFVRQDNALKFIRPFKHTMLKDALNGAQQLQDQVSVTKKAFDGQKYPIFTSIECFEESEAKSFPILYRYIYCNNDIHAIKWKAFGSIYYVSRFAIFDSEKRLMLTLGKCDGPCLLVDRKVMDRSDKMSKYIIDTYIPAFNDWCRSNNLEVMFTKLGEFCSDTSAKYMQQDSRDSYLNEKLHLVADLCNIE